MRIIRLLLLTCCAFVFIGCSTTSVRHSPNYSSVLAQHPNAIILPPEARIYEVDFSGKNTRLYDFEYNVETIIADQITDALRDKNIRAKLLTRREVHDQKLHEAISYLDRRYEDIEAKLYEKDPIEEKLAFNISANVGDVASSLASKNNADLVVLVSYSRSIKSSGSQTAGFMAAALLGTHTSPADIANLKIAIIEAKTGTVLWVNRLYQIQATFFSSAKKDEEAKIMKAFIVSVLEPLNKQK